MNREPKNLVIAVVGDFSCHEHWMKGRGKKFDLMLIYYGETKDKYKDDANYYLQTSGMFKLENIAYAVEKFRDVVMGYDAVWLPDDDVMTDTASINRLFTIFREYGLDLAQPSILCGKVSHDITRFDPRCILRYTNFVEMGFPIFKTGLLFEALPMFTLTRSGWGIDHLWSEKFKDRKMAMIDIAPVLHKVDMPEGYDRSSDYYAELGKKNVDSARELDELVVKYGLKCDVRECGNVKAGMLMFIRGIVGYALARTWFRLRKIFLLTGISL